MKQPIYSPEKIHIQFRSVSCFVKANIVSTKKCQILKSVNGEFKNGQLTAIIGASGAGKSTLLNIISGYDNNYEKEGKIYYNGHELHQKYHKVNSRNWNMSCYIMQDGSMHDLLTVWESMEISARLNLDCSKEERHFRIHQILKTLSLENSRNTLAQKLSGGERRRLSIAVELLKNPPVIFLDEPTSGVDDVAAKNVISLLSNLAHEGRTIVCTIHQPSAVVLEKFDHLICLFDGEITYQGSVKGLLPFWEGMDPPLVCPNYHNPADFLLEVCHGVYGDYTQKLVQKTKEKYSLEPKEPIHLSLEVPNGEPRQKEVLQWNKHQAQSAESSLEPQSINLPLEEEKDQFLEPKGPIHLPLEVPNEEPHPAEVPQWNKDQSQSTKSSLEPKLIHLSLEEAKDHLEFLEVSNLKKEVSLASLEAPLSTFKAPNEDLTTQNSMEVSKTLNQSSKQEVLLLNEIPIDETWDNLSFGPQKDCHNLRRPSQWKEEGPPSILGAPNEELSTENSIEVSKTLIQKEQFSFEVPNDITGQNLSLGPQKDCQNPMWLSQWKKEGPPSSLEEQNGETSIQSTNSLSQFSKNKQILSFEIPYDETGENLSFGAQNCCQNTLWASQWREEESLSSLEANLEPKGDLLTQASIQSKNLGHATKHNSKHVEVALWVLGEELGVIGSSTWKEEGPPSSLEARNSNGKLLKQASIQSKSYGQCTKTKHVEATLGVPKEEQGVIGSSKWRGEGPQSNLEVRNSNGKLLKQAPIQSKSYRQATKHNSKNVEVTLGVLGEEQGVIGGSKWKRSRFPNGLERSMILLERIYKILVRERQLTLFRMVANLVLSFVIGVMYFKIGLDGKHLMDNLNYLFFTYIWITFEACCTTAISFTEELPILKREHFNGWYSINSYFLALTISGVPIQLLTMFSFVSISYFMTAQPLEIFRFSLFTLFCFLNCQVAQSFCTFMCVISQVKTSVYLVLVAIFPFIIFCGFFVHIKDAPFFLQWAFDASFVRYSMEGGVHSIMGFGRQKLECSSIYCHFSDPKIVMRQIGMENQRIVLDILVLVGHFFVFKVVIYVALLVRIGGKK